MLGGRHDPLSLCCLHVVPAWSVSEKRGFLGSLRSALPCESEAVVFVAGDFNFPVDGESRLNVSTDIGLLGGATLSLSILVLCFMI